MRESRKKIVCKECGVNMGHADDCPKIARECKPDTVPPVEKKGVWKHIQITNDGQRIDLFVNGQATDIVDFWIEDKRGSNDATG